MKTKPQQRILVFTGNGKGKTTAALGMALRAAGHGFRVAIVQFVKCLKTTGEYAALDAIDGITIVTAGAGFIPKDQSAEIDNHRQAAQAAMDQVQHFLSDATYDVVILDEVCVAIAHELIDEKRVLSVLRATSGKRAIVLTGRNAPNAIIDIADTVTEMNEVKHAYQQGISAQEGVEF